MRIFLLKTTLVLAGILFVLWNFSPLLLQSVTRHYVGKPLSLRFSKPGLSSVEVYDIWHKRDIGSVTVEIAIPKLILSYSLAAITQNEALQITVEGGKVSLADSLREISLEPRKDTQQVKPEEQHGFLPYINLVIRDLDVAARKFGSYRVNSELNYKPDGESLIGELTAAQDSRKLDFHFSLASLLKSPSGEGTLSLSDIPVNEISTVEPIKISLRENALQAKPKLKYRDSEAHGILDYNFIDKSGNVELEVDSEARDISSLINGLFELPAGKVGIKALLLLKNDAVKSTQAEVRLTDVTLKMNNITITGLNGIHAIDISNEIMSAQPTTLTGETLTSSGLELSHPVASISINYPSLYIHSASGKLFGGEVQFSNKLTLPLTRETIEITFRGISIEKLLEFHPQEVVQATGHIDGELPLTFYSDGTLTVSDGKVTAQNGGGTIKYVPDHSTETNPKLAYAIDALRSFEYDSLSADVSYDTTGDMVLSLRIHGRNPNLNKDQPINVNLTLEENIPEMLQSIRLASGKDPSFDLMNRKRSAE